MNGKSIFTRTLVGLLTFLLVVPVVPRGAFAQEGAPAPTYSKEQLAQMLAPVALYPDSLLAQILVAATYPDQITEADVWLQHNGNLQSDALNSALDQMNWDLSVKALVPFPKVLGMMDEKMTWTRELGDAFLAQQTDVMDTVQMLRARAKAEGNLKSTSQQTVEVRGESIAIEPANPQYIYVPYYDPTVVYGSWWYPAYPPYAYFPYYPGPDYLAYGLFGFAAGIAVGAAWNWGWGNWDWGRRDCNINITRNININRNDIGRVRTANFRSVEGSRRISTARTAGTAAGVRGAGRAAGGTAGVTAAGRTAAGTGRVTGANRAAAGTAGVRSATRGTPGSRPSAASVQNQLRQDNRTAQRNAATNRTGGTRVSRGTGTTAGTRQAAGVSRTNPRTTTGQSSANLSRGSSSVNRGDTGTVSRGRSNAGINRGTSTPRSSSAPRSAAPSFNRGASMPRGGGFSRGDAGMPRASSMSRGAAPRAATPHMAAPAARGGGGAPHGGGAVSHGGGGGAPARHK